MSTFTNTPKNISLATNQSKNLATFTNQARSHNLAYILTDALDYVLVGATPDEILIWDTPTSWSNQIKN